MITLNQSTKDSIKKYTGKTVEEIKKMDDEQLIQAIEKKINKKLEFPKQLDERFSGRGSVYLFLNRFIDMESIEKKLSLIGR